MPIIEFDSGLKCFYFTSVTRDTEWRLLKAVVLHNYFKVLLYFITNDNLELFHTKQGNRIHYETKVYWMWKKEDDKRTEFDDTEDDDYHRIYIFENSIWQAITKTEESSASQNESISIGIMVTTDNFKEWKYEICLAI